MMRLVFYSIKSETEGKNILGLIKNSLPDEKTRIIRTLVGLASSLKNFPSPAVALFVIADQEELSSLLSLKKFLQNTRVLLILPDRTESSLRLSWPLSPLLVCFQDSNFSEVLGLMERFKEERQTQKDDVDPNRYSWNGELPFMQNELLKSSLSLPGIF
jgi:hypothetical protein